MTTRQQTAPGREGARLIATLEKAWAAIQQQHPEVPPVVVFTGSGRPARGKSRDRHLTLGHHAPDRWERAQEAGRAPELFIAGETIAEGASTVVETMLHEAAHALAVVRGIRDCSGDGNRWHNRKFAALAEEVGLVPPERAAKTHGFSEATLPPETAARYRRVIRGIDDAALPFLPGVGEDCDQEDKPKRGKSASRVASECGCVPPRRLQITRKLLRDGPVLCGLCSRPFAAPDVDEDQEDGTDE